MNNPSKSIPLWKLNFFLRLWSWWKVPLLASLRPRVVKASDTELELDVPLGWWSSNHLGSMYFGALCMGAEAAAALPAAMSIFREKLAVQFVFQEFHAKFTKRPESTVRFRNAQVPEVRALLESALGTSERLALVIPVTAWVQNQGESVCVGEFQVTLSVKRVMAKTKAVEAGAPVQRS